MAETSGTSFIPKNTNKVRQPRIGKRIYIFSYISYVMFFGTLITIFGAYLFMHSVQSTLEEQHLRLNEERTRFSEAEIARIRDLEKRLLVASRLVSEASAPSRLFGSLEEVIVDSVQLVDFSYERMPNNNFVLTFKSAMDEFDSAMFQQKLFEAVPALAGAEVAEFTYGTAASESGESGAPVAGRQLTVTYESTASTAVIPYEPAAVSVFDVEGATALVPEIGTEATDMSGEQPPVGTTIEQTGNQ